MDDKDKKGIDINLIKAEADKDKKLPIVFVGDGGFGMMGKVAIAEHIMHTHDVPIVTVGEAKEMGIPNKPSLLDNKIIKRLSKPIPLIKLTQHPESFTPNNRKERRKKKKK